MHSLINTVSIALLAFAISTDAFAAAVAEGAALHRPHWREALCTGLIFGTIEALTPLIGWAIGLAAVKYVAAWSHCGSPSRCFRSWACA